MNNKTIMLTINQLQQIMALSANRTLQYNQIIETENGGARVEFYLNEQAADAGDDPKEMFTLENAEPYAKITRARANVRYLLDNPAASIGYWAQQLEKAQKRIIILNKDLTTMDYTDSITATAAQHIANIKGLVKDLCKNYDIDYTLENLDIIAECRRAIEILKSKPSGIIYTIQFYDGLDYFEIKEGM